MLLQSAKFSDGSPILAEDVIFSFESLIKKGSPLYKIYYADVKNVEKLSDRHVRFNFKEGSNNKELPLILSQLVIYSKKDWQGKDFAKPYLKAPLGSGPYILTDFQTNKYLIFKRNPNYWAKDLPSRRGFFNFDEIRYDYYQDTTVTLQALFAGNIDVREEYIAKIWATAYNNDKVKNGQIIKEEIPHNETARLQNFAFNIRRPQFTDRRVREAIGMAFNFEWANEKLFYNQYERLDSLFCNTDLAAKGLPEGKEKKILESFRSQLPEKIFNEPIVMPDNSSPQKQRQNLRRAVKLLQTAGYDFVDGKMTNLETGEPLEIEVLSNSSNGSSFTRVMLPFIENLRKIGIKMTFRNLEVNIFKNRLDNFEFEMAILAYQLSNMPGNEQKEMWGSQSADVKGSFNILGVQSTAVDTIINGLINAKETKDYLAYVRALDRVIMQEHYFIPQWFSPAQRIAYNKRLKHKKTNIKTGVNIHSWWLEE